jgi:hypothetical protein
MGDYGAWKTSVLQTENDRLRAELAAVRGELEVTKESFERAVVDAAHINSALARVTAERDEARRKALEEAARWIESSPWPCTGREYADRIRALAAKEG